MANNKAINNNDGTTGTGFTAATDEIAGVDYQRIKLTDGTEDSTTPINAGNGTAANALRVTLASDSTGQVALAAGTAAIGKLAANSGVDIGDVDVTSLPALPAGNNNIGDVDVASIAAGDNNIGNVDIVTLPTVSSATLANVASSATSVTLLSSNASRKGASIYNDSTQVLYVKFGATASSSSFNVKMAAGDYFEFPQPCYSGVVDGIWASANGNARVMEV